MIFKEQKQGRYNRRSGADQRVEFSLVSAIRRMSNAISWSSYTRDRSRVTCVRDLWAMAAFVQRAAASQAVKDGCFDHLDVAYVQSLIRETDNDNSVKETNLHKPKAGENLVIRVDNKKGLVGLLLNLLCYGSNLHLSLIFPPCVCPRSRGNWLYYQDW